MDVLTPDQIRKNMKSIRSKDTKIEVLRKALWAKGYRYRKNYKGLPGCPFDTSRSEIYRILSTVRNKILEWTLLLEENGIIGEGMTFTEEEKQKAQNTQIINNYTNNFYSEVSDVDMKQG